MRSVRRHLTFSNIVALLALFLALGGSVYAASKINGKSIKKQSVPGNRLKPDSVTSTQVNESSLAQVPSAANADSLGGRSGDSLRVVPAFGSNSAEVGLAPGGSPVLTVPITMSSAGTIQASAAAGLKAATTGDDRTAICQIEIDGVAAGPAVSATADDVGASNPFSVALEANGHVAAGTHSVVVSCGVAPLSAGVFRESVAMNVLGIPD